MSQDLNAQNSGIKAVNSGPLVIRTYNDLSGNNTYMVGQYEKAIPSNYVLTTSTGGLLVATSTVQVSSINVASLIMGNATFSTLTGSTLIMNGPITCTGINYGYTTLSVPSATQIGYTISATIAANSGTTGSNFAPLTVTVGVWLVTFLVTFTGMNTFPNSVITIVGGPATSYPILTTVTANTGVGMGTYTYNNTSSGSVTLGLSVVTANSPITTPSSYYTATRIA